MARVLLEDHVNEVTVIPDSSPTENEAGSVSFCTLF